MEHPFRHFFLSRSSSGGSWTAGLHSSVLQYLFAEQIGISFTGLGNSNDLVGDGLLDIVGAVSSPQGDACLRILERRPTPALRACRRASTHRPGRTARTTS